MVCRSSFRRLPLAACAFFMSVTLSAPVFAATILYEIDQSPFSGLVHSRGHERDESAAHAALEMNGSIALRGDEPLGRTPLTVSEFTLIGALNERALSITLASEAPSTLVPTSGTPGLFTGEFHALLSLEGAGEPVAVVLTLRGDHRRIDASGIDLSLVIGGFDPERDDDHRYGSHGGKKAPSDDDDDGVLTAPGHGHGKHAASRNEDDDDDGGGHAIDLAALLAHGPGNDGDDDDDGGKIRLRATGAVVPEPSTGLLMGIGLMGLSLRTRRLRS